MDSDCGRVDVCNCGRLGDHGDPSVFGPLQLLQLAASPAVDSNTGAEGPARRVPPTLGDHGDPSVFGPLQLLQLAAVFSLCTVGRLYSASKDLLAEFKGGIK